MRSRLEEKGRSRRARGRDASTAGEESGAERGTSRALTDGDTDTDGNNWKIGLNILGANDDDQDEYGDEYM